MHFTLLNKIKAHSEGIWSVAIDHKTRTLITGSLDEYLKLWSVDDCELKGEIHGHKLGITSICTTGNNNIITNSLDESIKIWDFSGSAIRSISCLPLESFTIAVSPDGEFVAAGGRKGLITLFSIVDGSRVRTLETHSFFIISLKYSKDGRYLAAGTDTGSVHVIECAAFSIAHTFHGHKKHVRSLAFSLDSTHLVTGSDDKRINIYELSHGDFVASVGSPSFVLSLIFYSPSIVASGHSDGKVRVWDIEKKECLYTFSEHSDQVWGLATIGNKLVSVSDDANFCVFQITQ